VLHKFTDRKKFHKILERNVPQIQTQREGSTRFAREDYGSHDLKVSFRKVFNIESGSQALEQKYLRSLSPFPHLTQHYWEVHVESREL